MIDSPWRSRKIGSVTEIARNASSRNAVPMMMWTVIPRGATLANISATIAVVAY